MHFWPGFLAFNPAHILAACLLRIVFGFCLQMIQNSAIKKALINTTVYKGFCCKTW